MSETPVDYLTDLAERDQDAAVIRDVTAHIVNHYTALTTAGMPTPYAAMLCRDLQAALVNPIDAHMTVSLEGME